MCFAGCIMSHENEKKAKHSDPRWHHNHIQLALQHGACQRWVVDKSCHNRMGHARWSAKRWLAWAVSTHVLHHSSRPHWPLRYRWYRIGFWFQMHSFVSYHVCTTNCMRAHIGFLLHLACYTPLIWESVGAVGSSLERWPTILRPPVQWTAAKYPTQYKLIAWDWNHPDRPFWIGGASLTRGYSRVILGDWKCIRVYGSAS